MSFHSVTKYSTKTAILTLEHNYPPESSLKVQVDVRLLVNSFTSNETRIGEWVNVMGYISDAESKTRSSVSEKSGVHVQAIVLWSSGPLDLGGYEKSLVLNNVEDDPKQQAS